MICYRKFKYYYEKLTNGKRGIPVVLTVVEKIREVCLERIKALKTFQ